MSNSNRTLVTVATYNEMENLPRLVDAIFDIAPEVHILVVDDNSPDGTGKWCDEYVGKDDRLKVLHREGKLGLGTAMLAAMQYAIDNGYKQMLNMDADFSHHPQYIPSILQRMVENEDDPERRVDVVIGSRYVPGGGVEGWPLKRRLMSRGVNTYARLLLGLKTRDNSGSFRCYRTELLKRIDFDCIVSRGYSFLEEVLWLLRKAGARFAEVPIIFTDREFGQSKIHGGEAVAALRILLQLGIRNWTGRGPKSAK